MKLLDAVVPYWFWIKWGAVLIALALLVRWLVGMGYDHCELEHFKAQDALIQQAATRAAVTDKKLAEALRKLPPTGHRVSEAVHAHPTSPDCRVPDAVADELQDGIRAGAANTAP
jgi:hypothetical protein